MTRKVDNWQKPVSGVAIAIGALLLCSEMTTQSRIGQLGHAALT